MGSMPEMCPPSRFSMIPVLTTSPLFCRTPTSTVWPVVTSLPPISTVSVEPALTMSEASTYRYCPTPTVMSEAEDQTPPSPYTGILDDE